MVMYDETAELRVVLALTRLAHANLIAAARATLAAAEDGEADPLYYLRDELHAGGSR
jgi:DNA-binding XRE family transcriptional regulator